MKVWGLGRQFLTQINQGHLQSLQMLQMHPQMQISLQSHQSQSHSLLHFQTVLHTLLSHLLLRFYLLCLHHLQRSQSTPNHPSLSSQMFSNHLVIPSESPDHLAKNYMYLDVLLETLYKDFDVLFVQEHPWHTIRQAPSSSNKEGEDVTGAPLHPEWLYMVRPPDNDQAPRVMAFVSK